LRETIKSWTFKDVRDERDPKKKVTSRPWGARLKLLLTGL
jgi:hypothetical protein